MQIRIDSLRLDKPKIDADGFLNADAFVTRTGIFRYRHADGKVTNELRHPDDVFKEDSLATLKRKPVVDEHPAEGRVTAKNARKLSRGFTGDSVRIDEHFVAAPITINDEDAVKMVMDETSPKRELSCGYETDVIKEDGVFDFPGHPDHGQRYDHRQTNIKYNHVAIVGAGRAGASVRLRVDADAAVLCEFENVCYFDNQDDGTINKPKKDSKAMTKLKRPGVEAAGFKMDAIDVEVHDDSLPFVETLLDRVDEAALEILDQASRADYAEGERDELMTQVEELHERLDAAGEVHPAHLMALATERAHIIAMAKHLKVDATDEMTNDDLKVAIVQAHNPKLDVDELSYDNIEGRYGMIHDSLKSEIDALDSFENLATVTRATKKKGDADDGEGLSPRDKMIQGRLDANDSTAAAAQ